MNTRSHLLPSLVALVLLLTSCSDFLGIKPKGYLIPETVAEYASMLSYTEMVKYADMYPDYMTDDAFLPEDDELAWLCNWDMQDQVTKNLYTFAPQTFSETETDLIYNDSFRRINVYNIVIEEIGNATEGTEEEKAEIKAEACLGRAMDYLALVNLYAKPYNAATAATDLAVPLVLESDVSASGLTRATVAEVYDRIEQDLAYAEQHLPVKRTNAGKIDRPVQDMVASVYARMYLVRGEYDKALRQALRSLEHYSTLTDLNHHSVVSELYFVGRIDVPSLSSNPEAIYVKMPPYVYGLISAVYASEDLLSTYDEGDSRLRLYYSTAPFGATLPEDYHLLLTGIEPNVGTSVPETMLIAAECEARAGSVDQAMQLINTLRRYRIDPASYTPLTASDSEEALRIVLDERRRELAFTGLTRFIDLRRLSCDPRFAKTVVHTVGGESYTLEPNSPRYVLPIPQKVLAYNPGMPDNER